MPFQTFLAAPILCTCLRSHGVGVITVDAALQQAMCLSSSNEASLQATGSAMHTCSR